MIMSDSFIARPLSEGMEFSKELHVVIEGYQTRGLIVEVQYQINNAGYTALILGRKK